jgi:hypothetical protein
MRKKNYNTRERKKQMRPEQPRRTPYEIKQELEKKGLGHFNEEGEWVHDFIVKDGKMIPEMKEE